MDDGDDGAENPSLEVLTLDSDDGELRARKDCGYRRKKEEARASEDDLGYIRSSGGNIFP